MAVEDPVTPSRQVLTATRQSLHAVGELVTAGPQYRSDGTIRLHVTPGGLGGAKLPVGVDGTELVWDGESRQITGTCRELAATAGLDAGAPESLYGDGSGIDVNEPLNVDGAAADLLLR